MINLKRCHWVIEEEPLYVAYHDNEWGIPVYDDNKLFEMLVLESFQAGLSWICVLLDMFNYKKIANYQEDKVKELLQNPKIIRSRRKIEATIKNAQIFISIQKEWGSFSKYIWHFTNGNIIYNKTGDERTTSPLSDEVSKDLKRRGMKYVGSIIIYSYLQAIGIINDHEKECFCYLGKIKRIEEYDENNNKRIRK